MPDPTMSFARCSFLTQQFLLGWRDDTTPDWGKMIHYSGRIALPEWHDWPASRDTFFGPLCARARSVDLFGNEYNSELPAVLALREFVEQHFTPEGRRLVCRAPRALVDAPLFWTGGNQFFALIKVLAFDGDDLPAVLAIMRHHHQSGIMSPRTGGFYTNINRFARSLVRQGQFAIISDGIECELHVPGASFGLVEAASKQVEERRLAEAKMVRARSVHPAKA